MAQITSDKLCSRQRELLELVAVAAVLPRETDRFIVDFQDTAIANGSAADISAEVFDGVGSCPEGFDVNTPFFVPNLGINIPLQIFELLLPVGDEEPGEFGCREKKVLVFASNQPAVRIQSCAWNDVMNVRVWKQLLVPGMKDSSEAVDLSSKPLWIGQGLRQGSGRGLEKDIEGFGRMRAKEKRTQLRR